MYILWEKNYKQIYRRRIFSFQSFATKLSLKTFVYFFKYKPMYFVEKSEIKIEKIPPDLEKNNSYRYIILIVIIYHLFC